MAIISFKGENDLAEALFHRRPLSRKQEKQFPKQLIPHAEKKLDILNQAFRIEDLYFPPSNHFENLSGNWSGYYSIRVKNNTPWRIVFKWQVGPELVQIVDYH